MSLRDRLKTPEFAAAVARARIKLEAEDRGFYRGVAVILGWLARDRGETGLVEYAMHDHGLTLDDFIKAKVEPFDLDPIKRVFDPSSQAKEPK